MKTYLGNDAPLPDNDDKPHPVDVVFQLGRTKRFGGWGNPEWTVLHHSMLVSLLWTNFYGPNGVEHALLHDAHEAYTGDIPSPVKQFMGSEQVKMLESDLDERIRAMVGIERGPETADKVRVKLVDQAALIIEAYYFGTKGSFHLIGEKNWGHEIGVTEDARTCIRSIIGTSCPEVLTAMNFLSPNKGLSGNYIAVYA